VLSIRNRKCGERPALRRALLAGMVLAALGAPAASAAPPLALADPALAAFVRSLPTAPGAWREVATSEMPAASCTPVAAADGWLALTAAPPVRMTPPDCPSRDHRRATMAIGRQVGIFVTNRGQAGPALDAARLYRAAAGSVTHERWRDVDPALPDLPVALLLPAPATPLWDLLSGTMLQAGCLRDPARRRIFDADERRRLCETLRADGRVHRRQTESDVAGWLAAQGPGAVAFVSFVEFLRLGDAVSPLPVDGALPTFSTVAADQYPVARTLYLSVGMTDANAASVLQAALPLVGEDAIGPAGVLAAQGVVPLPASRRVDLRETLMTMGGAL